MSAPTARAAFKKKDGIVKLSPDQTAFTWTPLPGTGPPVVSLAIANITNLQQTPDSSPKVMLKIFEKNQSGGEPASFMFHFNSSEARPEANSIKDTLSRLITNLRSNDPSVPKPAAGAAQSSPNETPNANTPNTTGVSGAGASASMTFAATVNSQPFSTRWFDDNQLKFDIELQQSLMKKDRDLHQTYMEARSTKPETISDGAFNTQFWSTRTNQLRAHAIDINQKKGAYNVLSTVKPRTVDGELKLNITVEQVQMIFSQNPLVKRIYNENVPKVSETEFWSRFFLSRLSKILRGDRVTEVDNTDALFDKYDVNENVAAFNSKMLDRQVPQTIDLEANEEDLGGFKGGNRKDVEMRPRRNVPIIQTLNTLSEKIMANVAPSDADPHAPKGMDEETYNELVLRDLVEDREETRFVLNVKEQSRFFSSNESAPSALADIFAQQNPADVLRAFSKDMRFEGLAQGANSLDLHAATGIVDDSDSDKEGGDTDQANGHPAKRRHIGSRAARSAARASIFEGIRHRRSEKYGHTLWGDGTPMGLPQVIADRCALTHATTIEFLHQFWSAFLSGDPDRAMELQYLAESLQRSTQRIEAVADEAERERDVTIAQKKREIREYYERTRKKIRWKADSVGGGRQAALALMKPTIDALKKAQDEYAKALSAEGLRLSTEG